VLRVEDEAERELLAVCRTTAMRGRSEGREQAIMLT